MKTKEREEELNQKIARLPAWAQKHIESLTCQRDNAQREQMEYLDAQTESPFYVQYSGPKNNTNRYVQAHSMVVKWAGVKLLIDAHDLSQQNGPGIRLRWESEKNTEVALIPLHHQACRLVTKEDMD